MPLAGQQKVSVSHSSSLSHALGSSASRKMNATRLKSLGQRGSAEGAIGVGLGSGMVGPCSSVRRVYKCERFIGKSRKISLNTEKEIYKCQNGGARGMEQVILRWYNNCSVL